MREIKINEVIKELRTDKGISQETLADVCDVSMQAVSKWENGQSCPDISFLPLLAEYFGVSTDFLLTGRNSAPADPDNSISSSLSKQDLKEDVLYIIQYRNGKIVNRKRWNAYQQAAEDIPIRIQFDDDFSHLQSGLHIEVWGDANIEAPDVNTNLTAGGNARCNDNIQGNVSASASVYCNAVEGNASVGNSISCDTIKGNASVGCSVSCCTIQGDVSAGTYIACCTIGGDAKAGTHIEYH